MSPNGKESGPGRRLLLVANRKSRNGNADLAAGLALLRARGFTVVEQYPSRPRDITDLVFRYRHEVDAVLVGGGDGTMNCAAGAIRETALPLGILPMGTANDLARTLEIPADPVEACRVVAEGHSRLVDLGCVNDVYFFNAASIGLGVEVTRRLTSEVKSRWGVLGYARTVYDAMQAARRFSAEVTCDGTTEVFRSIQITVGNGRYYGGGMTLAEDAALDDGRLDMYSLRPQGFFRLVTLAPALRFGRHEERESIQVRSGTTIEIHTRRPRSVTTDGEIATRTPARFHVEPQAIRVYAPAPSNQ